MSRLSCPCVTVPSALLAVLCTPGRCHCTRMRCAPPSLQADIDNNGQIDYTEFITATMQMNRAAKEENIRAAFQHFDQDGSG